MCPRWPSWNLRWATSLACQHFAFFLFRSCQNLWKTRETTTAYTFDKFLLFFGGALGGYIGSSRYISSAAAQQVNRCISSDASQGRATFACVRLVRSGWSLKTSSNFARTTSWLIKRRRAVLPSENHWVPSSPSMAQKWIVLLTVFSVVVLCGNDLVPNDFATDFQSEDENANMFALEIYLLILSRFLMTLSLNAKRCLVHALTIWAMACITRLPGTSS